ncbi:MAG TPA: VanZ family protein [Gemmatimonadaceae bacterium]|nr:VanZ family protein [Gemmatimonadaceae bacterium]
MTFDPTAHPWVRYAARGGYVLVVLLATLTHFHFDPDPAMVSWRWHRALVFATTGSDVVDAARNVLLFAGFGAVWVVTSPRLHPWREVVWITVFGCVLSTCVETAQLFSASRTASVNDVTTNTLGALLGAAGVVVMTRVLARLRDRAPVTGVPLLTVALSYWCAVGAEMFSPLYRHGMNPWADGSIANRLANALRYVKPFTVERVSLTDMALFAPGGAVMQVALVEFGMGNGAAAWLVAVAGAVFSLGVELAHGIAGQPIEVSAIVGHAVGIACGALLAWCLGPSAASRGSERQRARVLAAALGVLLVAWAWRPFVPRVSWQAVRSQVTAPHLTPLGVLGTTSDLFGVMDVAEQFFLYVSIGVVLAAWPLRYRGWVANLLPGLYLAAVLEVGQIVVLSRVFDVTDLLTQCAAVAVGFVVARRAGCEARGELLGRRAAAARGVAGAA